MFVPNWSAVPVGHIQPAKVRDMVGELSDDGLLQRFMIVMPPAVLAADPDDDDIATDRAAIDQFSAIVETLHGMKPPPTQSASGRQEFAVVEAGPDVHAVRRRLFRLVERIEADLFLPAALKEAASKWRGLLARMALVFHVVELAEARRAGRNPDPAEQLALKAATVEKACRFIMRVVVPSTFRFHTEIGSTDMTASHARWVAGYLLSRKLEKVTSRDVGRAYRRAARQGDGDPAGHGSPRPCRVGDPRSGAGQRAAAGWSTRPSTRRSRRRQRPSRPGARRSARRSSTPSPRCSAASVQSDLRWHAAVPNVTRVFGRFGRKTRSGRQAAPGIGAKRPKRHLRV